tara:strand:- start:807 stop:1166 length:360 start_codon:yes stop_codon:yes gene_type:complete
MSYEYYRFLERVVGVPENIVHSFVDGMQQLHKTLSLMTKEQRQQVSEHFPEVSSLAVTYGQVNNLHTSFPCDLSIVKKRSEELRSWCTTQDDPHLDVEELIRGIESCTRKTGATANETI